MAIKSAKSRSELNTPIRKGLELLCQTFGGEVDSWQRRAYERALADIPADILSAGVDYLAGQAAAGRQFYPIPTAPQWKGACAEVMKRRRQEAFRNTLAAECPDCGGSRWKPIEINGVERLQRCGCWQAATEAMQRIGQPIALPASREDEADAP